MVFDGPAAGANCEFVNPHEKSGITESDSTIIYDHGGVGVGVGVDLTSRKSLEYFRAFFIFSKRFRGIYFDRHGRLGLSPRVPRKTIHAHLRIQ